MMSLVRVMLVCGVVSATAFVASAGWIGAGAGGSGTDLNDTANWADGVIDGDFSEVTESVDLYLSDDLVVDFDFDFREIDESKTRHITIGGEKTLYFNKGEGTSGSSVYVWLPNNKSSSVRFKREVTIDLYNNMSITCHGICFIDALITGAGQFTPRYGTGYSPKIVLSNDKNSFSGQIGGDKAGLYFTSVASNGVASALGAGSAVKYSNYPIYYIGARSQSTDRQFYPSNVNEAGCYNLSGCGSLNLLGEFYTLGNGVAYFGGVSEGEILVADGIKNSATKVVKRGSTTLRLTGHNTYGPYVDNGNVNEHVEMNGGVLIADCERSSSTSVQNRFLPSSGFVKFTGSSELVLQGKSGSGNTTAQALSELYYANRVNAVVKVDGNGGDGTELVMGSIGAPDSSAYAVLRFEKAGNATIKTSSAISEDEGGVRITNGVLMGHAGSRATVLVREPSGLVGFAAQDENNELYAFLGSEEVTVDNMTSGDGHAAISSEYTKRHVSLNFTTLSIDASSNAVELDMNGKAFQNSNSTIGRGIVINGSHPVTIRNGYCGAQDTNYIYNYGTGGLIWSEMLYSMVFVVAGPGLTIFDAETSKHIYLADGVLRMNKEFNYSTSGGVLYVLEGGIIEVGANLSGGAIDDFTRKNGDNVDRICFFGSGGFSAHGANRRVNVGGDHRLLTWGSGSFVVSGKPLILSSPHSDATVEFRNPLGMGNVSQQVYVNDGAADVDATLFNNVSGNIAAGLVKSGPGTLRLFGSQLYPGDLSIIDGRVILDKDDILMGQNNLVLRGSTLKVNGKSNSFKSLDVLSNSVVDVGSGSGGVDFGDSSEKPWSGTLTISGTLQAQTLRFGEDSGGLTSEQLELIEVDGGNKVVLDANGYLCKVASGTMILVR